jgi:hypothetical protein
MGEDDQCGTLNLITPERVATALVRRGRSVSLSYLLSKVAAIDNPKPMLHYMSRLTLGMAGEPKMNEDFIGLDYHGKLVRTSTRQPLLVRWPPVQRRGLLSSDCFGARFGAVTSFEDGIVGRSVLLTWRHLASNGSSPGTALSPAQLEARGERRCRGRRSAHAAGAHSRRAARRSGPES